LDRAEEQQPLVQHWALDHWVHRVVELHPRREEELRREPVAVPELEPDALEEGDEPRMEWM
jgi:hypothetical protein